MAAGLSVSSQDALTLVGDVGKSILPHAIVSKSTYARGKTSSRFIRHSIKATPLSLWQIARVAAAVVNAAGSQIEHRAFLRPGSTCLLRLRAENGLPLSRAG